MGKVDFGFDLPFPEQADFLRKKLNLPSDRWDSIEKSAHDRGFIVAGATKADLIQDLHNTVDKYVANGGSWENFKTDFKQIVTDHGWHGWTGEGTKAGENWRTKIILETNIRSSYAAGRWQQLQAVKTSLPFWEYHHNDGVLRPRPLHKQWGDSRLCLPADHPWWQTHYPPNGWRCRCRVVARFKAADNAATTPPEGWNTTNPKTGEPPGIDKGWGYAPGANVNQSLEDAVAKKLIKYEPAIRSAMEHHLAQVKPQASLNKMSALKPIEGEVNLDKILARGGEMDKLIVEQIPKELINDPIEWEKQYRAILKNYMDQNHGAGSTILEADVYHLNGKTVTPAESSVAFEQQTKLNTAVNLLPDHWIKQANSYQKDGKARRLNILLQKPKRESFRGDLHAINASTETVYSTFLHEFIHGMQRVRPDIDKIVQELHIRRTSNKKGGRQALRRIYENKAEETGRKDKYTDPYFGKQYKNAVYNGDGGAREVFTMSFQHVLRGEDRPFEGQPNDWLHRLKTQQGGHGQEIINLVLGLLTGM